MKTRTFLFPAFTAIMMISSVAFAPPHESLITAADLLGKINPARDSGFTLLGNRYCARSGHYLRNEAYLSFVKMYEAAAKDGIILTVLSSTRTFSDQKTIWENKWSGKTKVNGQDLSETIKDPSVRARAIMHYSSMPGTSRHHWGTEVDLVNLNKEYFDTPAGRKVYLWLHDHAHEFGFCQPYTEKNEKRPDGYEEEKWHWSYMPLSAVFYSSYIEKISYSDITGFTGSAYAKDVRAIESYVKGINGECAGEK